MSLASGVSAVVPVKDLQGTKSRLAPILDPGARAGLTLYMMGRVVAAIRSSGVEDVCVVSPDRIVLNEAQRRGAIPLVQESRGLNPALEEGRRRALELGASTLLVFPADLPLLEEEDVRAVLKASEGQAVVISPDGARCRYERAPDATPRRAALRLRPRQLPGAPGGRPQAGPRRQGLREVAPGIRPRHGGGSGAAQEERGGAPVKGLQVLGVEGFPEVRPGDDLNRMIQEAVAGDLRAGDVLVVTHKIVSKAEGRLVDLRTIEPSALAKGYATRYGKDARQIEVVLRESRRIVRMDRGIVISETHHGFVCANAGVDASNVPGDDTVCLLPIDPDASATKLREALARDPGVEVAVIISDSFGRAWRHGITDVAIGVAGMDPVADYRGLNDPHGFPMEASVLAVADELAAAAELVMGKTDGIPLAIVRGYSYSPASGSAGDLLMPPERDMFR